MQVLVHELIQEIKIYCSELAQKIFDICKFFMAQSLTIQKIVIIGADIAGATATRELF